MKIVVGLGETGFSCARYFTAYRIPFVMMDTRSNPPHLLNFRQTFPSVPVYLENLPRSVLNQATECVVSPGVSLEALAAARITARDSVPLISDIELFARATQIPIIGISGTNAKGTVTTLVGKMIHDAGFKVQVGGNIGIPVLDLLLEKDEPDFYVLEISSFQLERTYSLAAKVAILLNISEDHLDWHKTLAAYLAAKQRIYSNCEIAVWNRDDNATCPHTTDYQACISFTLSTPEANAWGLSRIHERDWLTYGKQAHLPVDKLLIPGKHNWSNALAALTLGQSLNLPIPSMLKTLQEFTGLPHRCEWVSQKEGITWYNDSKATNVGAALAAIEGLGKTTAGKLVLIMGGLGKAADFSRLRQPVAQYARAVVLMGQDRHLLKQALNHTVPLLEAGHDLQQAIFLAKQAAKEGDTVLLSPACASQDMFKNYVERGELFKKLICPSEALNSS